MVDKKNISCFLQVLSHHSPITVVRSLHQIGLSVLLVLCTHPQGAVIEHVPHNIVIEFLGVYFLNWFRYLVPEVSSFLLHCILSEDTCSTNKYSRVSETFNFSMPPTCNKQLVCPSTRAGICSLQCVLIKFHDIKHVFPTDSSTVSGDALPQKHYQPKTVIKTHFTFNRNSKTKYKKKLIATELLACELDGRYQNVLYTVIICHYEHGVLQEGYCNDSLTILHQFSYQQVHMY